LWASSGTTALQRNKTAQLPSSAAHQWFPLFVFYRVQASFFPPSLYDVAIYAFKNKSVLQ
jgi:hypothetical protein